MLFLMVFNLLMNSCCGNIGAPMPDRSMAAKTFLEALRPCGVSAIISVHSSRDLFSRLVLWSNFSMLLSSATEADTSLFDCNLGISTPTPGFEAQSSRVRIDMGPLSCNFVDDLRRKGGRMLGVCTFKKLKGECHWPLG